MRRGSFSREAKPKIATVYKKRQNFTKIACHRRQLSGLVFYILFDLDHSLEGDSHATSRFHRQFKPLRWRTTRSNRYNAQQPL
jgi:hypothetical protein